ncbi:hypothetical protein W97_03658 [Coniosporium apollinis CBS 100218]|uniref:5'-3' DNA helicase ZGRF1-like N-terminal domain-containing protein n=1 Tax=Coniosporium apollinis (strain CBS 100218) TaxID=1168221 RepID=R7YR83_CONA1|nr:uncharacterized protein W97_03658 [Coniosporium apollinis CBS 100218]EON64427.1 hypothetical protein W97_03658 [Coniosporium apollinis CBS 100218]
MSTAVYSTPSLSVPPSQNTAPVIEFRCLYTHDVRRKQKRWQDGFLRFHTFNKRVMVYDVPRNYVGDHHWKEGAQLQEGDEVTLDKGVLVEVGEVVGTTETDLSPLFERKPKETPEKAGATSPAKAASSMRSTAGLVPPPLRHRSLNTLLGTPRGSLGRAVLPSKSPYEARQGATANEWEDGPAAKRPRIGGNSTYTGWDVLRTTKVSAFGSKKETPLWAKTSDARKGKFTKPTSSNVKSSTGRARLTVKEVVDITSDPEDNFSDMTLPGTLIAASTSRLSPVAPASTKTGAPLQRTSNGKPEQRISRAPNGLTQASSSPLSNKNSKSTLKPKSRPPLPPPQKDPQLPSSPPVSTTNKIHAVQNTIDKAASTTSSPALRAAKPLDASADSRQTESASNPRTKALRLSVVAPRKKMLLCEARPKSRQATSNSNMRAPIERSRGVSPRDGSVERQGTPDWDFDFGVADEKSASPGSTAASRNPGIAKSKLLGEPIRKNLSRNGRPDELPPADSTTTPFDEMALVHGKMDAQLTTASTRLKSARPNTSVKPGAESANASRPRSPFRRVRSENDAALNPSDPPAGTANSEPAPLANKPRASAAKATAPPKRPLQRWKSLADAAPVRRVPTPPPPPVVEDTDIGPWSTEAFDLFDWRPPNRDSERNVVTALSEG